MAVNSVGLRRSGSALLGLALGGILVIGCGGDSAPVSDGGFSEEEKARVLAADRASEEATRKAANQTPAGK